MKAAHAIHAELSFSHGAFELDVSFVAEGTLAVVGPNGAGKSSLLAALVGARAVRRGRITVGERVLLDTERGLSMPIEQRRLAFVPQDYALFPHLSARGNVEFALACAQPKLSAAARAEQALARLSALGVAHVAEQLPRTLSGGEKQRLSLARALAVAPEGLLLDEPLAALDVPARREVRAFLAAHLRGLGLPTVIVTHDPLDAQALADRIAVLERGRLTQLGTWSELSAAPASPFVRELVSAGS